MLCASFFVSHGSLTLNCSQSCLDMGLTQVSSDSRSHRGIYVRPSEAAHKRTKTRCT